MMHMIANKFWCEYFNVHIVTGTNLVYSFSFLRNWSIYTILFSHLCFFQNDLSTILTLKGLHYITKNIILLFCIEFRVSKLQINISQNVLFVGCNIFFSSYTWIWIWIYFLSGYKIYLQEASIKILIIQMQIIPQK